MLKAGTRVYVIKDQDTGVERLVDGSNASKVRNFVTKNRFPVELADQRTIARLSKAGVDIETCEGKDGQDAL